MREEGLTADGRRLTQMEETIGEWKKLDDVAYIAGRIGWKGLTAKEYTKEGPLFLSVHSLNYGDYVDFRDAYHISQERYDESPEIMLQDNDVLICKDGAGIGKVGIIKTIEEPTTINSSLLLIRANSKLIPKYLYYSMLSPLFQNIVQERIDGATTPHLYQREIKSFPIPVPPLEEQKRIVAILDKAFAAIDRAKENAERNLQNSRELFESYLNGIEAIKCPLGELVDIKTGKLDANAAVENGKYPFFTCSREIFAIDDFAFDCEAILLAGNNAVGDFNVKHYIGKFNAYQRTYVITVNSKNKVLYRYLFYQMLKSLKEFKEKSVGAGTKFLKMGIIQNLQIPLLPVDKQKKIVEKLDRINDETNKLQAICRQKINSLGKLKKSILQKAFEGEL